MASVFTKIIQGELPAYRVFEDEKIIAILALDQVTLGHTIVIPKSEINHWYDVPSDLYSHLQVNAQKIGKAIQKATGVPRVLTAAVGFEVPHYHLHLIPATSVADLNFGKAQRRSEDEMKEVLGKIHASLG